MIVTGESVVVVEGVVVKVVDEDDVLVEVDEEVDEDVEPGGSDVEELELVLVDEEDVDEEVEVLVVVEEVELPGGSVVVVVAGSQTIGFPSRLAP